MSLSWVSVIALGSGGLGSGLTALFSRDREPAPVVDNSAATIDAQVAMQLSNLDLLEPVCSTEYIQDNGNGLCRELFCWMDTISVPGEASDISCDAISNINNTITILNVCSEVDKAEDQEACYTLFLERK